MKAVGLARAGEPLFDVLRRLDKEASAERMQLRHEAALLLGVGLDEVLHVDEQHVDGEVVRADEDEHPDDRHGLGLVIVGLARHVVGGDAHVIAATDQRPQTAHPHGPHAR
jgi:hypothetical protein